MAYPVTLTLDEIILTRIPISVPYLAIFAMITVSTFHSTDVGNWKLKSKDNKVINCRRVVILQSTVGFHFY